MVKNSPFSYGKALLCFSFSLLASFSFSQQKASLGAASAGISYADLFIINTWTVTTNPAALSKLNERSAGISYFSPFSIQQLSSKNLLFAFPLKKAGLGASISRYGYENYHEDDLGISFGRQLSPHFSMGIQINYLSTTIADNYGKSSSFSANMAMLSKLSEKIEIAALLINPTQAAKDEDRLERYPQLLKLGLNYSPIDYLSLSLVISKEHFYNSTTALGISYTPKQIYALRLGYSTETYLLSFGFGLQLKNFYMDMSYAFSNTLGFSPSLSISFQFPSKSK